jgi:WD40 repeat protein/DNA-binding SARP family transcriptional activator
MEFRILGPLVVVQDGESFALGAVQQRALLAVLLLHRGEAVSVDRLIDELWGERAPAMAAKTVQVYVSRLRKALGASVIVTEGRSYRLAVAPEQVDAVRFEALRADGRRAFAAGDVVRATELFGSALALWRGEPLADFAFEPFAQAEIGRLREARLGALEDRIEAELALGRDGELIPELESLVASNPLQERLRGHLMLALYRAGRQAEALSVYRETSVLLRDELGLEPSRRLRQLERAILEHDASLEIVQTARELRGVCPFKGLAFFDRSDADYFCGRERLVSEVLARLVESSLVGILGPSGIGKSSLLRAGVLPALSAGMLPGSARWRQVVLRPGAHPEAELARALAGDRLEHAVGQLSSGERLVIAVDQLEELFTQCESEGQREAFLEGLAAAALDRERYALVIVSLRADFYGRLASYPRFAGLLSPSHVLLGPMDRDELARAIQQPAARAGLELEPGLADALVAEVEGEPGGLPLLSTTLLELWRGSDGRRLSYDTYRTTGGVRGAVARLAERSYSGFGETEQRIARGVMLRLAGGEGETLARRRVSLGELERIGGARLVLAELIDARLLTVSDGEVELSHEALLREWPRYRTWLEEARIDRRVHAHLSSAARDWDERGRDVADVYKGSRLVAALEWRAGHALDLNETERAFLDASRAVTGRAQRRLWMMLAGAAFLLAIAIAGGVVALDQRSGARNEARVAEAQRLGVQALSEPRLDRSLLLARQGVALDDSVPTRSYLFEALLRGPAALRVIGGVGNPLSALDLSPDGRTLSAGDSGGNVLFFDALGGRRVGRPYTVLAALGGISAVRFSPDGRQLAVAVGGGFVDILDADTHRYLRRLFPAPPSSGEINNPWVLGSIAFSPDSREVWADVIRNQKQGSSGYIMRWDARTGRGLGAPRRVDPTPQATLAGFIGRGAQVVTSSGAERTTVIRDAATLRPLRRLRGGSARTALSPNGRVLALGGADGSVRLLDLQTGNPRVGTAGHDAAVTDLRFAPDSRTLLSAGADGRVIAWNVADARRLETFTGHAGAVSRVTIAPDGRTAYSAGVDGTVIAWDLVHDRRLDRPFSSPPRHAMVFPVDERGPGGPTVLAPSGIDVHVAELAITTTPDGGSFAVPDDAGYIDVFDSKTLTRSSRIPVSPGRQVSAVALGPDGRTVAATTADGYLRFADLRDPRRLGPLLPGPVVAAAGGYGGTWSLAFSGDGQWLATAGLPTSISPPLQVWDVRRRKIVNTSVLDAIPTDLTFSPDGKTLAVAVTDGLGTGSALEILSLPSLRQLKKIPAPAGTSVKFSPDGRLLAFGDGGGRVWLYDTRTWRPRGRPLLAHTAAVATVNFSPDGQTLATTSDDGMTRLWDLPSGRPIGTALPGLAQRYVAAAFVDDGTHLVTLDDNGRGDLWDIQPPSWARRACAVAARTLTRAEWNDALPERTYAPACTPR